MNSHWENRPATEGAPVRGETLRRVFLLCKIWVVVCVIISSFLMTRFLKEASRTPDVVLFAPDGRAFRGAVLPYSLTQEVLVNEATDLVEAMFMVTEKGVVKGLESHLHPFALKSFERAVGAIVKRDRKDPYFQSLNVEEARLVAGSFNYAEIAFRGIIQVRSLDSYAKPEVFLYAQFRPGTPSEQNPLGWQLYSIITISKEEFYANEINDIRRKALEQGADAEAEQPKQ